MNGISKTRKVYFSRLFGRVVLFLLAILLYLVEPGAFDVAKKGAFFAKFSPVHLLWALWVYDMVLQLIPVKAHISIGSQKVFPSLFRPMKEKANVQNLKQYVRDTTAAAYKVMLIWLAVSALISVLYRVGVVDHGVMVLIAAFFYVCDLICVLVWCPFRLIMKNKCCTTCRIFNWDHLMMFLPIVALGSAFSWSLVLLSVVDFLVWEICVFLYPERFWENSNMALKCSECTDKLCTQYCRKLRK